MFGDEKCVFKLCEILGYTISSKSGLIYFEVPNSNINDQSFITQFPYKLKIFVARESILHTLMIPKQQFKDIDGIIMVFSHYNLSLQNEVFEYFKKFIITTEFTPQILAIGLSLNDEYKNKWSIDNFFRGLEFSKIIFETFECKTLYRDLNEENKKLIFSSLLDLIKLIKESQKINIPTILINKMLQKLKMDLIHLENKNYNDEEKIFLLGCLENIFKIRITRYLLSYKWGLENKFSKNIIDQWEFFPELIFTNEEEKNDILYKAQEKLKKCQLMDLNFNLINLLILKEKLDFSKKYISILVSSGIVKAIASHIYSNEYIIYDNLQDIIVIFKGQTIYIQTSAKSDEELNLFIGLIQTIEIVRDNYLSDRKEFKKVFKVRDVEILEFGELHAIIGNIYIHEGEINSNLKVILRLKEHPQDLYIEKTRKFLFELMYLVPKIIKNNTLIDLNEVKPYIDELYNRFFNPFPEKISFKKNLSVSNKYLDLESSLEELELTKLEKLILKEIKELKSTNINQILLHIQNKYKIAKSDILNIIFDLIEEDYLVLNI